MLKVCRFEPCEKPVQARGLCNTHYRQERSGVNLYMPPPTHSSKGLCVFPGCVNQRLAKSLCSGHYHQMSRGEELSTLLTALPRQYSLECSLEWCSLPRHAKGYCATHYSHSRSARGITRPGVSRGKTPPTECTVDGCGRNAVVLNRMCQTHSKHMQKYGKTYPIKYRESGRICGFEGCERKHVALGLCGVHRTQQRSGRTLTPVRAYVEADLDDPSTWPRFSDGNGYILLTVQKDYVVKSILEHRHVMQQHLGRDLLDGENVHHINGVRSDNRISNLELWSTSQPPGQRAIDKLNWARELMELYGPIESELNEQRDRSKSFHEPLDIAEEGA